MKLTKRQLRRLIHESINDSRIDEGIFGYLSGIFGGKKPYSELTTKELNSLWRKYFIVVNSIGYGINALGMSAGHAADQRAWLKENISDNPLEVRDFMMRYKVWLRSPDFLLFQKTPEYALLKQSQSDYIRKDLEEGVNSINERKKRKSRPKKASDHANYTAGRSAKSAKKLDALTQRYKNAKTQKQKMAAIKARDRFEKTQTPSGIPSKYNMSEKLNRESLRASILEMIESELSEKKKRKKRKKKSGGRKISSKVDKALKKKAKDRNAPVGALKAIYKKGMGAFYSSGSRSGQNPHSWAMARVNSVLGGGKARSADATQWKSIQKHRKKKRKK